MHQVELEEIACEELGLKLHCIKSGNPKRIDTLEVWPQGFSNNLVKRKGKKEFQYEKFAGQG